MRLTDLPDTTGMPDGTSGHNWRRAANNATQSMEKASRGYGLTWFHIIRAAFWTAMSKTDPKELLPAVRDLAELVTAWADTIEKRIAAREHADG